MQIIYAARDAPETITKSIFLAGPSPRKDGQYNWRPDAIKILEQLGFDGTVFIPLPEDGGWPHSYDEQVNWETRHLNMADVVVFWVPRDLTDLPAFTTNVEFGMWYDTGKAVLGYPPDAKKMKYLDHHARRVGTPVCDTLEITLQTAVDMLGDGAARTDGERFVPLHIWRTPQFQQWYAAQTTAGNRLDGAEVVWSFRLQQTGNVLFWALHVDVHIAIESRNKTIEIVLSRPDLSVVVAYYDDEDTGDTKVVLVREFRSPASTKDGFVLELPGGSSKNPEKTPAEIAIDEFHEETGLKLDPKYLTPVESRQLAATLSAHRAHVFTYQLDDDEYQALLEQTNQTHGESDDTELTYLEIHSLDDILYGDEIELDWSNLGMLYLAIG